MGLVGNILLSSIILVLMNETAREKLGNWLEKNRFRILVIPGVLLAINALLLKLGGVWDLDSFVRLTAYFLVPTMAVILFNREAGKTGWKSAGLNILILAFLWLPVAFRLIQKNWKFSEYNYSLTALSAVIFAIVVYSSVRKLDFSMAWQIRWQDLKKVLWAYLILAGPLIAITLLMGFTKFNPNKEFNWGSPMMVAPQLLIFFVGLWFAPALVEEIIFRGVIQNILVDRLKPFFGILVASVIFGFSHIGQKEGGHGFPNWRYVALASFAGAAYGLVFQICKKRGSRNALAMAALLHCAVDFTWFVFLRNR